jgi:hypothetical protein
MNAKYLASYRDEFGEEQVTIENDGKTLSFVLRGKEFKGKNFHAFAISNVTSENRSFNLCLGDLCGYAMDCDIPIWPVTNNREEKTHLHVHIEYDRSDEQNKVNHEVLQLVIEHHGQVYRSDGRNSYNMFDEQLTELTDTLPPEMYLKTCWNCAFSDYFIARSGIFGEMACFRNTKDEYRQVRSKIELVQLWKQCAEDVQEIYLYTKEKKHG